MPIKVTMPALSPTMEEGTLARWLKQEGDTVNPGDVIAEIETDKATMEVEAVDEGTMGKIVVAEGTEGVKVNATIAWLLEEGEDAGAIEGSDGGAEGDGKKSQDAPKEKPAANADGDQPSRAPEEDGDSAPDSEAGNGSEENQASEKVAATDAHAGPAAGEEAKKQATVNAKEENDKDRTSSSQDGDRIIASPLARRMAKQADLDLAKISGSGPNGRIVRADIEKALSEEKPREPDAKPDAVPVADRAPSSIRPALQAEEIPHSNVRKVIAKRLTEADRDVPQFYLSIDCEIDKLLAARKEINEALDGEAKVSVNDMVIKAVALALRKMPEVNAQWTDSAMKRLGSVDVSVAVAYDGGLITPIVFDADQKGLAQISIEMKDLAGRAKDGKLKPEEYQGGSFSVSNLGMFGINHFTAIINPPQSGILAVGAGEQRVVVKDGEMTVATVMTCTMTCDHRVIDGALGAQWLNVFKGYIERPASMLA